MFPTLLAVVIDAYPNAAIYGGARHHPGFGVQSCKSAFHYCAELSVDHSWDL